MSEIKSKATSKPTAKLQEPTIDDLQSQLDLFDEEERKIKEEQESKLRSIEEKRKAALESIKVKENQDKLDLASKFVPLFDLVRKRNYSIPEIIRKAFVEAKIEGYFISIEDPTELNKKIRGLESRLNKKEPGSESGTKRSRTVHVRYNRADFENATPQHLPISFGGAGNKSISDWWDKLPDHEKELNKIDINKVNPELAKYLVKAGDIMGISKTIKKKYPNLIDLANPQQNISGGTIVGNG